VKGSAIKSQKLLGLSQIRDNLYCLGQPPFFLSCVVIEGVYGGATASRKILIVQALSAAIGLFLVASS